MTDAYSPERLGRKAAIENHDDLLIVLRKIKDGRGTARRDLLRDIFETQTGGNKPSTMHDQTRAFNIGAGILLMMDFGVLHDDANISGGTVPPVLWRDDVCANDFLHEALPYRPVKSSIQRMLVDLRAKKLMKNAKLRLKATNDIRRHLVMDKKERTVWIFQHTTALRELLVASESDPAAVILPRSLILEVLDTIHHVLFPLEPGSQKMLKSFVSKEDWDKGMLFDMSIRYRKDFDAETTYGYFGDRLRELHKEVQNPTPHGWLERRLQRKNETYMLKATMYGVFIAVTLGFLGLGVAVFQAWVGYQQWKHPVKDS
jgi:hypothetical protein